MLITDIIEYFRSIANTHKNIMGYRTGERYELNESGLSYPLLFLNTDFRLSYDGSDALFSAEYVDVTFRLSVITLSREANDLRPDNEIKLLGSTKQNQDLASTAKILTEILIKMEYDFNEMFLNGWMLPESNAGTALKRIINDDCDGWFIELTIRANNDLICTYEDSFGDDIIDEGTNKTQFQSPTNINPIV